MSHQLASNASTFQVRMYVDVVDQRSPPFILIEKHAHEGDDRSLLDRDSHQLRFRFRIRKASPPYVATIVFNAVVEKLLRENPLIRAAPTQCVQVGQGLAIRGFCVAENHPSRTLTMAAIVFQLRVVSRTPKSRSSVPR